MELKARLTNDMKDAMKSKAERKLSALRMLIAEIKKREIDKKVVLDDAEILKVISTMLKQRQDSVDAFEKGDRPDLVASEKEEMAALKVYLPQQLERAEVEALVAAAIAETGAAKPDDLGKVMKAVLPKVQGRADGKMVNEIVRKKLGG